MFQVSKHIVKTGGCRNVILQSSRLASDVATKEGTAIEEQREIEEHGPLITVPKAYAPWALPQDIKDKYYPSLGNRDIVGPSRDSFHAYYDFVNFPMPGVRWGANTDAVIALREKEKGDWKNLSLEEKKQLYRNSYRQTLAEVQAKTGDWKRIWTITLHGVSLALLGILFCDKCVYRAVTCVTNEENAEDELRKYLHQNQGPVSHLSSKYDFDEKKWKK